MFDVAMEILWGDYSGIRKYLNYAHILHIEATFALIPLIIINITVIITWKAGYVKERISLSLLA
jgi:hypothetical protein